MLNLARAIYLLFQYQIDPTNIFLPILLEIPPHLITMYSNDLGWKRNITYSINSMIRNADSEYSIKINHIYSKVFVFTRLIGYINVCKVNELYFSEVC